MMKRRAYSAGAVKTAFWFSEFRQIIELRADGIDEDEIKRQSCEENLFGASTPARARQIYSTVSARLQMLNPSVYPVFIQADITMQKILTLSAVLAYDTLFFDFIYEVVREKIMMGTNEFADSDLRIFFARKQQQDKRAATWTDPTLVRLGRSYKTMLYEAGFIDKGQRVRHIRKPILDPKVEQWLQSNGMEPIIKALMGVR
jgi:hypothetical protein